MTDPADDGAPILNLRLLSTTDLHGHITAWDYFADRATDRHGLVRTASLLDAARAGAPQGNVLVVDCGDFLQGNPLGDLVAEDPARLDSGPHPVIAAMNAAGIEVATLGNHDFNFGLEFLDRCLAGADFPVVTANVVRDPLAADPLADTHLIPPFAMLEKALTDTAGAEHLLTIGVLGLCPTQIMGWDHRLLAGRVDARDMRETLAAWAPELRARGADLVVVLAHCGINPEPYRPGMEQAALHLASVPGVDVIICGHQHQVFPGPDFADVPGADPEAGTLNGTPAVMAGAFGSHLGVLDLRLERGPQGWRIAGQRAEARPIFMDRPRVADAPGIRAVVADAHRQTLDLMSESVGHTPAPVTTHFAMVADCAAVQVVTRAQAEFVRRELAGTEWEGVPVLSVSSPFKAGGGSYTAIPAGPVALRDVADLYLYPNAATALLMTGEQVSEWLERAAAIFRQVAPGARDAALIDPAHHTYNFDVIDGVTYAIDLSQPARYDAEGRRNANENRRIKDLCHDGRPVAPGDRFVLATNSYRAGGGGNFPGAGVAPRVMEASVSNRDILLAHVRRTGGIDPATRPNWRFHPLPGTSVSFVSSPAAVAELPLAGGPEIEPVGPDAGGGMVFRLRL
ncbi:bifunctional 2',3'-cyclic-nucleotide 2'-phosphodiesterase/3'-nucleotidase [Halovulum dunhuangense]|uniref:Bifunctional 2',3'-cyclic-nucleotide 2'-phosphodiesterase/3'-nucleotidase n=1 Tax=Halovulum dunhuangense TaxID=1505036 RepID=A0A849L4R2_9RHOB|nr:bifunctional 2',3'-cyclic-nucleotide 2'-phosphodiesterase/3'-nucleotidase [Halovulum dunhuangense]NNU81346.1 bifunctional 2',3'-cyclic-nucleotide 2'-phosphodiesterase/3'-nucleotidase [Halovulum dunhuangense]